MSIPTAKRPVTFNLAVGIFVLLWAVYLLVYSGNFLVIDEQHIFAVAESMALRGAVDANQVRFAPHILPASGSLGPDGNYYTVYGPAVSYLAAPLVLLARALPHVGAAQLGLLLNPLLTALTAVLVLLYVQRLYGSSRAGLAAALLYGLCTIALPYTKWLYTEPLSALALFGTAWALLRYRDKGDLLSLALAGALAGLSVTSKFANGIALPAFLLYGGWAFWRHGRPTPRRAVLAALAFGLPLAAFLAGLGWFNYVRFGSPLSTGYAAYAMQFTLPLWEGLYGLLVSPGKGFLLYSPILLLWPLALPAFLRRHTPEALLNLAVIGAFLITYGLFHWWYGGTCWGPRYIVPLAPFFLVGTVPALRWLWRRWPGRIVLALLVVLSAGVQFLGAAVNFSHYLSLLERQIPNAEATVALFDPRYSPLVGHAALALNPHNLNLAWLRGVDGTLHVDWVPVLLALALAGSGLVALASERRRVLVLTIALAGAVVIPWVSLVRYYDDPRYAGNAARWALLHHLETTVALDDAVISHDAGRVNFYLNYSPVTALWFGVPRESLPLSAETGALLERLVREHDGSTLLTTSRLWVILPRTPPGDPASGVERWLAERTCPTSDTSFSKNLRLASLAVPGPATWHDSGVTLGDAVRLEAYALPDQPSAPGDVLCLTLRWRCLAPPDADYTVFVQVLGPDGLPVAQSDRPPVAGFRLTSAWSPGDAITDRHGVPLPADLPPGEYRLIAGLYRADTGIRLPTPTGDFVDLGTVRVGP